MEQNEPKSSSRGFKNFNYGQYVRESERLEEENKKTKKAVVIDISLDE